MKFKMPVSPIFILSALGVLAALAVAFSNNQKKPTEPPVFNPAANPYAQGIYANGIVESFQTNGENINIYPEVGGTVTKILVAEGQAVEANTPLVQLDDSVQRATTEQLLSQVEAATSVLEQLLAMPRKENLAVAQAQVEAARANVKSVQDQLTKIQQSYRINPKSISKNDLDNAKNAVTATQKNLIVAIRQYELTKAGAWIFDIRNQEKQVNALKKQVEVSNALLEDYTLRAPTAGVVLSIKTAVGSYISPQGVYGTYTQGFSPILVMGGAEGYLQVRTYVDEILIQKMPAPEQLGGQMYIRGTDKGIPLEFVRLQPYVTPKIQLSDQRQEKVDVRVLPVIFKFIKPKDTTLYPGQLVDVYLGKRLAQLPGTVPPPEQNRGAQK